MSINMKGPKEVCGNCKFFKPAAEPDIYIAKGIGTCCYKTNLIRSTGWCVNHDIDRYKIKMRYS
jgi:hypothetical protein